MTRIQLIPTSPQLEATETVTKKKKRKRSRCICSKKKKVAYCNKYEKLKRKHRKQKKQSFKQPFMKEKPMFNEQEQPHPSEVSPFDIRDDKMK